MFYMIITLLIHYIHYVKMQLNEVISIGWYQAFVAIPIQFDTTKNNINADTGIGIGASLSCIKFAKRFLETLLFVVLIMYNPYSYILV